MEGMFSLRVVDGHVISDQTYVYGWIHPHDHKIMYVGATWLHPAARAEMHLHGIDADTRVVGEKLVPLGIDPKEPLEILVFPLPQGAERPQYRLALIALLAQEHMLSDAYFGPAPETSALEEASDVGVWGRQAVEMIKGRHG